MRISSILFIICLSAACSEAVKVNESPAAATLAPTPAATALNAEPSLAPEMRSVVKVSIYRPGGARGSKFEFEEVHFKQRPDPGSHVTVIPLGVNLPPQQLQIISAKQITDPCTEQAPKLWAVELETVTQAAFADAVAANPNHNRSEESPFDALVVYPAVTAARALNRGVLEAATLPAGVAARIVVAAIDLTGDQAPEILLTEFCCQEPLRKKEDCDYTCGKTYLRVAGKWKLLDSSQPC